MVFFMIFSKIFKKPSLDFQKFKNLEDLNPVVGTCGVISGVANHASEYDCSNPRNFRDLMFFKVFKNFSKNLDIKIFNKIEVPIFIVRLCQGTPRSCNFCLQI